MVTFVPQPIAQGQINLGQALQGQAGQGVRSTSGLSPFANLIQGLQGGIRESQGRSALAGNQQLQQEALAKALGLVQGGGSTADIAGALGAGTPDQQRLGLSTVLADRRSRAAADRAREITPAQERKFALEEAKLSRPRFSVDAFGRAFNENTGGFVGGATQDAGGAGPGVVTSPTQLEQLKAEARGVGKVNADLRKQVATDSTQSRRSLVQLKALRNANEKATTGTFSGVRLTAGRFLQGFGIDPGTMGINPNLPASELLNSVGQLQALAFTQLTKGAISEKEFETFQGAAPGLRGTKEGNKKIIDFLETIAKRQVELARRVSKLGIGQFNPSSLEDLKDQIRQEIPIPLVDEQRSNASAKGPRGNIGFRVVRQ